MLKDYFIISIKNLRNRKLRSWLTMIGIIIGIIAVVSLISLGQGLKVVISSQFGDIGTDKLALQASGGFGPPGTDVVKPLTKDHLEKVKKVNGVKIAAGRLLRNGKLEHDDHVGFGMAATMSEGDGRKLIESALNLEAEQGRLLRDGDSKKVLLGNNFGEENAGFGKQIIVGSKVLIQEKQFQVVGILKKVGSFITDNLVLVEEDDLREILDIDDEDYDIIVMQVNQNADIKVVQENVEKLMRKERDVKKGEEDFTVQTPQAILGQVNSTLFAVQLFVYIIASISIIVGGIGIMNTMFTSVLERTKQIGIMKSIGARNSTIFSLFFIESGLIGGVGGIIGAIFGVIIAMSFAFVGRLLLGSELIMAEVSIWLVLGSIFGSFILGSIFGVIPAINASKLHPVDALRHTK
jgi:putative ABC transport system permease protein|tara:strand:+ start:1168 stop:2391 length:1224 start_codon:yes stop_codon:yes gene_type:complete